MQQLIVNLHRRETANVGDQRSAPLNYFDISERQRTMEITGWKREDEKMRLKWMEQFSLAAGIIYGGGGLMEFEKYESSLRFVADNKKKTVIWGAGHNTANASWAQLKPRFKMDYSGFGLIGCRDFGYEDKFFEWVPCASCMHTAFDKEYSVDKEIAFFGNSGMKGFEKFIPEGISESAIMFNIKQPIEDVISFLASAETIVSSSYHGVYWASLLGKKVVGVPTSSKFYGLKHPIPICAASDWQRYRKLATAYPEALFECRQANIKFSEKVSDYFFG